MSLLCLSCHRPSQVKAMNDAADNGPERAYPWVVVGNQTMPEPDQNDVRAPSTLTRRPVLCT